MVSVLMLLLLPLLAGLVKVYRYPHPRARVLSMFNLLTSARPFKSLIDNAVLPVARFVRHCALVACSKRGAI